MSVIFDFDCTITSRHMYYFTYNIEHFLQLYNISETEKEQYRFMSKQMNKTMKEGIMSFDEELKDFIIRNIFGGEEHIMFMKNGVSETIETAYRLNVDFRTAAYINDLNRIIKVYESSGISV